MNSEDAERIAAGLLAIAHALEHLGDALNLHTAAVERIGDAVTDLSDAADHVTKTGLLVLNDSN